MPYGEGSLGSAGSQFISNRTSFAQSREQPRSCTTSGFDSTATDGSVMYGLARNPSYSSQPEDNLVRYPYEVTHGMANTNRDSWPSSNRHFSDAMPDDRYTNSREPVPSLLDPPPLLDLSALGSRDVLSRSRMDNPASTSVSRGLGGNSGRHVPDCGAPGLRDRGCSSVDGVSYTGTGDSSAVDYFPRDRYGGPEAGYADGDSYPLHRPDLNDPNDYNSFSPRGSLLGPSPYSRMDYNHQSAQRWQQDDSFHSPVDRALHDFGEHAGNFSDAADTYEYEEQQEFSRNRRLPGGPKPLLASDFTNGTSVPSLLEQNFDFRHGQPANTNRYPPSAREFPNRARPYNRNVGGPTTGPPYVKGPPTTSKNDQKVPAKAVEPKEPSKVPLYCEVCKVKLNAEAQALQHYGGKLHAKKLRLLSNPESSNQLGNIPSSVPKKAKKESKVASAPSGSKAKQGNSATAVIPAEQQAKDNLSTKATIDKPMSSGPSSVVSDPLVYCNVCGVSFNSNGQADLHYNGKKHKARVATTAAPKKVVIVGSSGNDTAVAKEQQDAAQLPADASGPSIQAVTVGSESESNVDVPTNCVESNCDALGEANSATSVEKSVGVSTEANATTTTILAPAEISGNESRGMAADLQNTVLSPSGNKLPSDLNPGAADQTQGGAKKPGPLISYSCDICNVQLTSQAQLNQHLQGAKHSCRVKGIPWRQFGYARKRQNAPKASNVSPLIQGSPGHLSNAAPPPPKRQRGDSRASLPSGRFFCDCCNATCDSELSFNAHLASKRHQLAYANRHPSDLAYNY